MTTGYRRLTERERSNLVAYLDHELDDDQTRSIEQTLIHSATARREVEDLRKTWDLLDHLPRPALDADWTEQTVTKSLAHDQQADLVYQTTGTALKRIVQLVIWVASAIGAGVLGYVLTHSVWPDRSARLIRDIRIVEELEAYRSVGSPEFLNELDRSRAQLRPAFRDPDPDLEESPR